MEQPINQQDSDKETNEQAQGQPNTENGDLEYTPDEIKYADGHGTKLDEEIEDEGAEDEE